MTNLPKIQTASERLNRSEAFLDKASKVILCLEEALNKETIGGNMKQVTINGLPYGLFHDENINAFVEQYYVNEGGYAECKISVSSQYNESFYSARLTFK